MSLHLHRSNRTEALVARLAELVRVPCGGPLEQEWISVQGRGMERWIAMELADRLGVWAQARFPFPRRLIDDLLGLALGPARSEANNPFDPAELTWHVAARLGGHFGNPAFAALESYVGADPSRLLPLSQRIATVFDQYVVYRPEWVLQWEGSAAEAVDVEDWQAQLWRSLSADLGATHVAARAQRLRALRKPLGRLPRRVSIFGVSTLPPLYLEILARLSEHLEIHVFAPAPSQEFFADFRRKSGQIALFQDVAEAASEEEEDVGHPLVASLGRVAADFQNLLETLLDGMPHVDDSEELFETPEPSSLLSRLQSEVCALRRSGRGEVPAIELDDDDDSIRVHSCHGPMREVEVLHEELLATFAREGAPSPNEIVVLLPDVETYAPYVDAVFGRERGDSPRIPYRVADRPSVAAESCVAAFFHLLDVIVSRFTVNDILDFAAHPAVAEHFDLSGIDLRPWLADAAIRWGIDAAHRESEGLPAFDEHGWRQGLDRLLLGRALPDGTASCRLGAGAPELAPVDGVEGERADRIGSLADLAEILFDLRRRCRDVLAPAQWARELSRALSLTLANTPANSAEHQRIRAALTGVAERAERAGFEDPVDLRALRAELQRDLDTSRGPHGFLGGGVTFCAFVPMRSIPFRVVAMLGMGDEDFPRSNHPPSFDRIAAGPARRGDRSQRDDDRYLFLEAILAARERVIITYPGRGVQDDRPRPPSVVVADLLDVLAESTASSPEHFIVEHPLHGWSPRYFAGHPKLRSFDRGALAGARQLLSPLEASRQPLIREPLAPPAPEQLVELDRLARFFKDPAASFLRDRLGIASRRGEESLSEDVPLEWDGLEAWAIATEMLEDRVAGRATDFDALRRRGRLPIGAAADAAVAKVESGIAAIHEEVGARAQEAVDALEIDLEVAGRRLVGRLEGIGPTGRVQFAYSRMGAGRELTHWIEHLALCAVAPRGVRPHTYAIGRATSGKSLKRLELVEVDDPIGELSKLLALFDAGSRHPLPLFGETSRAFAEANATGAAALAAARSIFDKEFDDPRSDALRLLWGTDATTVWQRATGLPALDGRSVDFASVSRAVWAPVFAHSEARGPSDGEDR